MKPKVALPKKIASIKARSEVVICGNCAHANPSYKERCQECGCDLED